MTPTELREAAERLGSGNRDYWFAIEHKPEASKDADVLRHHILATTEPDGEDGIDEDYIRSELNCPEGDIHNDNIMFSFCPSDKRGEVSVWLYWGSIANMRRIMRIESKQQFADFCRLLGIQRRAKS